MTCKFAQELKVHPMKATLVDCIDVISFPLPFNVKDSSLEDKAIFSAPLPVLTLTSLAPPSSLPTFLSLSSPPRFWERTCSLFRCENS